MWPTANCWKRIKNTIHEDSALFMRIDQYTHLKQWFDGYSRSFLTGRLDLDRPLTVKIEHSARVCDTIAQVILCLVRRAGGRISPVLSSLRSHSRQGVLREANRCLFRSDKS